MAIPDATRPIDNILARLQGVRKTAGGYTARCPAHDDRQQSLSIGEGKEGEVLLHCFAGCQTENVVAALGLTMADLYPQRQNRPASSKMSAITVEELAHDKGLPVEFLKSVGVEQGIGGIKITYRLMDGSLAPRQRWRRALRAKDGSSWLRGKGAPVPYGLWMLERMREKSESLVLVEGESDCWTLWYHGFPALGIPGADMAKTLELSHVESFPKLHIFQEPDKGGTTFVSGITETLAYLGYAGQVYVVQPDGFKDPNELHKLDADGFKTRFQALVNSAQSVSLPVLPTSPDRVNAPEYGLTDLGNARRLIKRHGKDIHYCYPWDKWLVWDGIRWTFDISGEVYRRAKDTVVSIYAEAAEEGLSEKERAEIARHAMKSESDSRINAMVNLAKSEPGVPVSPEDFDSDPWLLNVQNGTLNLRTFELQPHRREDLIMKLVPANYDPQAQCPLWLSFLDRVMGGSQSLTSYLQRVVGYTITGDTREQVLFMLYGTGANGKSTFLETLKALFGDYGQQADFSTFLHSDQDRVRNDIARLLGKRFVAAIEADAGRRLAEVLVKQLTGGDTVTARFLYREYFEFKPTFKIFLAANAKPTIRGQDHGIWRRIRLIPFTVTIPEQEQDRGLPTKLQAELPGILAWAVAGCKAWQRHGLDDPQEVLSATQSYREEMDILGGFIDECCVVDRTAQATTKSLYAEYLKWCEENAERPITKNTFGTRLKERGFEQIRIGKSGSRGWLGVGLQATTQQQALMGESESQNVKKEENDDYEPF